MTHSNKGMFFTCPDTGHIHLCGTDDLGRDIFVRLWEGARVSLTIAFVAVLVNCVVGLTYGGISGYFGGWVDNVMMRVVEVINGIPYLIVVILLMMVLEPGMGAIIVAYSLVGWTGMARLGARPDCGPERAGVRHCRAGHGRKAKPHHCKAPAAQSAQRGNCERYAGRSQRHLL